MAYADRFTGTDLVIEFTPEGGSLTTISGDYTMFSMDRKMDTVDVTAGNEIDRSFLTTQRSLDWNLSIFAGSDTLLTILKEGAKGLLAVYPKGKVTGRPMRSFNVIVTSYQDENPFDGAVEIEIGGIRNGAMITDIGSTVP